MLSVQLANESIFPLANRERLNVTFIILLLDKRIDYKTKHVSYISLLIYWQDDNYKKDK